MGQYVVNFSTAMTDANYAVSSFTQWSGGPYMLGYTTGGYLAGSLAIAGGIPAGSTIDIATLSITIIR